MKNTIRLLLSVVLVGCLTGPASASVPGPTNGRYDRLNGAITRLLRKNGFPHLRRCQVLAPPTGRAGTKGAYNCIAHSVKVYDRWVWPGTHVADFDHLYRSRGYRRTPRLDFSFDPALEKVVLYAKAGKHGEVECTHAARQLSDGSWSSKLGSGPLIRHASPDSLDGSSYGRPIALYVRPRHQSLSSLR